jgi:hypothetical protein
LVKLLDEDAYGKSKLFLKKNPRGFFSLYLPGWGLCVTDVYPECYNRSFCVFVVRLPDSKEGQLPHGR